jgi:hypothetical protein
MNMRDIFSIFFAIFWGATIAAQAEHKPFGWLGSLRQDLLRIIFSVFMLDVLPAAYFVLVAKQVNAGVPWSAAGVTLYAALVSVVLIAIFGLVAIYRIWLAMIQWCGDCFYGVHHEEGKKQRCALARQRDLACGNFVSGVIFGILSLILFVLFVYKRW